MNILLHTCCGNCAVAPFKMLKSEGHSVTGFWFNPNIHPLEEYDSRLQSLKKLTSQRNIDMLFWEDYQPADYFDMLGVTSTNLELIPPSPGRCRPCYELRLGKTAEEASKKGFDAFSTTLLISPYQDFDQIAAAGKKISAKYKIDFYLKDFRHSFRDSMSEAKELGLYSQKYCGCVFSRAESKDRQGSRRKV
ncbi:MAG: epoxyqueuosine reductase QueH [Thermodesulfovibrionia bacterium]|nr:epoxyqueuosine reductase QueH [Thermodesulfovibrionia bacterium]